MSRVTQEAEGVRETLALRYPSMDAARRDRLGDVRCGLIVRTRSPLRRGDSLAVKLELEHERVALELDGEVLWVTPLLSGALAGVGLVARQPRAQVQLDLLFGHRTAGPERDAAEAVPAPAPPAAPAVRSRSVSVAMLQPNPVFRQMLTGALKRLGGEKGAWDVSVDATGDADAFLEALAGARRDLAILDCDALGLAAAPLVEAIRSHDAWLRLPVILLGSDGKSRIEDPFAVFMRKPIETKPFLDLAGILVGAAR